MVAGMRRIAWRRVMLGAVCFAAGWMLADSCRAEAQSRLMGWEVTTNGGLRIICRDPVMWESLQEIECEELR